MMELVAFKTPSTMKERNEYIKLVEYGMKAQKRAFVWAGYLHFFAARIYCQNILIFQQSIGFYPLFCL